MLVIDDEPDFLLLVRETLTGIDDLEVVTANSGFMAGLEMGRLRPDVILLDLMMPDIDGFEVFRLLQAREAFRDIPVIACTAFADESIVQRTRDAGFSGFISKPLVLATLEPLIRAAVRDASGD